MEVNEMGTFFGLLRLRLTAALLMGIAGASLAVMAGRAQHSSPPAFVIVERIETTGDESIQDQYAKVANEILPKYGGHYLARSRNNALLEGGGPIPCCIAILEFPDLEAARRWYDSPENQKAAKIRLRGAKFRLVVAEGLNVQQ
jgi:uncharacterized protein (DUF1330 family)